MQINVQARNFTLSGALRSHAERRLRFALSCRDDHVQRIVIWLYDTNGPRKRCYLRVLLVGLPDVIVEDTDANLNVAIDRAADRARRTVILKIDRQQTMLKQDLPLALVAQSSV